MSETERIPYGEESLPWESDPCHDCWAERGELHKKHCDVEECPICGGQLLSCGHADDIWGW